MVTEFREVPTHTIEWSGIDCLVDLVGTSDRMRGKKGDDLKRSETSGIIETLKNLGHIVLRLGDQAINSGDGRVRTTGQELETRGTLSSIRGEQMCGGKTCRDIQDSY